MLPQLNLLADQMKRGNVTLFCGHELSVRAGLRSWQAIAGELSASCGLKPEDDPAFIMLCYQNQQGLAALNEFMIRKIKSTKIEPSKAQLKIAELPVKVMFTTAIDDLMERAYAKIGKEVHLVVSGEEIPYWTEDKVMIVKLYGDISRPDSLILTRRDYNLFSNKKRDLESQLKTFLIRNTFLFICPDLHNWQFRQMLDSIAAQQQQHKRLSFVAASKIDQNELVDLEHSGVKVINLDDKTGDDNDSVLWQLLDFLPKQQNLDFISQRLRTQPLEKLAIEVKDFLKAMGHEIINDEPTTFAARKKSNGQIMHRCYKTTEGAIGTSEIKQAQAQLESMEEVSQYWLLMSYERITPDARRLLQMTPGVKCFSLSGFYREMIDFSSYLRKLVEDYSLSEVSKFYVDLPCTVPQYDSKREKIVANDPYESIDKYLGEWLESDGKNHVSLLGNFGTGKTWFCKYYAAKIAHQYLNDPDHNRIPILISLRDFKTIRRLDSLITTFLVDKCGVDLTGGFAAFNHLNRYDHLLLIFDGFDEMAKETDYDTILKNFAELTKVVEQGTQCKVIMTCRTSYFRRGIEERDLLSGEADLPLVDPRNRPNFDILYLHEFDEDKIRLAIQKRRPDDWSEIWRRIKDKYDLANLASRPVLLSMVIESLTEMEQVQSITITSLYESYTRKWIHTQHSEERTLITPEDKAKFMQELAWLMYENNDFSIHYTKIPESVQRYFVLKGSDIDHYAYDIQSQSFLVRDDRGYYSFAHQSFVDFFVAKKLMAEMVEGSHARFGKEYVSDEVHYFMKELSDSPDIKQRLINWVGDHSMPITVRRNCMLFLAASLDEDTKIRLKEIYQSENELSIAIRIAVAFHKSEDNQLLDDVTKRILEFDSKTALSATKSLKHTTSLERSQDLSIDGSLYLNRIRDALEKLQNEHIKRTAILVLGRSRYKEAAEAILTVLKQANDTRTTRYAIIALAEVGAIEAVKDIEPFLKHDDPVLRKDAATAIRVLTSNPK